MEFTKLEPQGYNVTEYCEHLLNVVSHVSQLVERIDDNNHELKGAFKEPPKYVLPPSLETPKDISQMLTVVESISANLELFLKNGFLGDIEDTNTMSAELLVKEVETTINDTKDTLDYHLCFIRPYEDIRADLKKTVRKLHVLLAKVTNTL